METLGTGAAQLNLLFQIGSARSIYFDFNTDVSGYTFEFVLKKNKGARVKTLSLTLGSGISFPVYVSDQILVSFSTTNTSIEEGEYYWELRKSNSNISLINGFAYFSYDAPSGSLDSSVSLTVDSQVINVTIANITGETTWGGITGTLASQTDLQTALDGKAAVVETLASNTSSTASSTITLNFESRKQLLAVGSASFSGSKTIALSNNTNALVLNFHFQLSASGTLTFPSSFRMDTGESRWNAGTYVLTLTGAGFYELSATYDGTRWKLKCSSNGGYL